MSDDLVYCVEIMEYSPPCRAVDGISIVKSRRGKKFPGLVSLSFINECFRTRRKSYELRNVRRSYVHHRASRSTTITPLTVVVEWQVDAGGSCTYDFSYTRIPSSNLITGRWNGEFQKT